MTMTREGRWKELRSWVYRSLNADYRPCLAASTTCKKKAVRAHSVPNGAVLTLLEEDGHVISPKVHFTAAGVHSALERVGRNHATTFTGLCAAHDHQMFNAIDRLPIDLEDPILLFLLAYRAVLREYYVLLRGAIQNQAAYRKKVALGLISGDRPTPDGLRAVGLMANAFEFHEYKLPVDQALAEDRFELLHHTVLRFPGHQPTVAVSSCLMFVEQALASDPKERLILSVFPDGSGTNVVVSATRRDRPYVEAHLSGVLAASQASQKYFFSKLILQCCENFVLSPRFYNSLTAERRQAIGTFYSATLSTDLPGTDNAHLFLF
jgi:hypothetical protein